jgi:hypothetical protein
MNLSEYIEDVGHLVASMTRRWSTTNTRLRWTMVGEGQALAWRRWINSVVKSEWSIVVMDRASHLKLWVIHINHLKNARFIMNIKWLEYLEVVTLHVSNEHQANKPSGYAQGKGINDLGLMFLLENMCRWSPNHKKIMAYHWQPSNWRKKRHLVICKELKRQIGFCFVFELGMPHYQEGWFIVEIWRLLSA